MLGLFKPGMLGVVADAGCMIVVLLTPIRLMQKIAIIGTVWVLTISVSAVVLTPVLLSALLSKNLQPEPGSQFRFCAVQGNADRETG